MRSAAENEYDSPASSNDGAAKPAAGQPAAKSKGAADARRAGELPAAAVAPLNEKPWRWAPRPKPDPRTAEPECGWQHARQIQAKRRAALTAARRRKPRQAKEAGVGALCAAKAISSTARELERQKCPVEQAMLALQRRGRIVYRLSVHGGPRDIFFCSGKRLTEAELIIEAGKLRA